MNNFFFLIELESTNSNIEICTAIETIGASSSKDVTLVPSGKIKKIIIFAKILILLKNDIVFYYYFFTLGTYT